MNTIDKHISDHELICAADGELTSREHSRIAAHLESCWKCRTRHAELERTIAGFMTAQRHDIDPHIPPVDGPRALLQARLSALQSAEAPTLRQRVVLSRLSRLSWTRLRTPVYASLIAGTAVLLGFLLYSGVEPVRASSTPNARLTPGATRAVVRDEICSSESAAAFHPIPATLANRVFEEYKIRNPQSGSYEVDYLITPALGGSEDIHNLWPQPYESGEWNAHVKDALENRLRELVCSGQIDLKTAQRDIAGDWIAAYRKYFNAEHPLPVHMAFSLDAPWTK